MIQIIACWQTDTYYRCSWRDVIIN